MRIREIRRRRRIKNGFESNNLHVTIMLIDREVEVEENEDYIIVELGNIEADTGSHESVLLP